MDIRFVVNSPPVPQGRPRVTRWGTYMPKRTVDATKIVRDVVQDLLEDEPDGTSEFGISCTFYLRKKGYGADLSNLIKLVEDACNKLVWKDDVQIVAYGSMKKILYSDNPRSEIRIWTHTNGGE